MKINRSWKKRIYMFFRYPLGDSEMDKDFAYFFYPFMGFLAIAGALIVWGRQLGRW